ncbi:hypothetical protein BLA24_04835 [Streptomyces cinnamoneus]|uniref:Uncharacterized protein n=1 Tax=Streptomyces cinnamoneus TaxID=53446 RepID=A0A2G1XNV2_STRCJ|nr:hypothetical protein [Streptomyces cinnamoneus]PHQ52893.1 hypothetical protein BLA24_04835 [Streptomyces cinnamoneus]PPT11448.1 hypothetical protein CYQ11_28695 [Streptomyces cinnamoneus]
MERHTGTRPAKDVGGHTDGHPGPRSPRIPHGDADDVLVGSGPMLEDGPPAEAEAGGGEPAAPGGPLLRPAERDEFTARLQDAMNGFVDGPGGSVEEADALLGTLTARLGGLLDERRGALRTAWQDESGRAPRTEELRLVLLDYRNLVERLVRL